MHAEGFGALDVGASTASITPRSPLPAKPTFLQPWLGSRNGTGSEVSNAMTMNRLPWPSAVTAAMLPSTPSGTFWPTAKSSHADGSKFSPSGSLRSASSLGSMPVLAMSLTS